jgi:glycosyltransferase involved in cell wall biosynthesis
MEMPLKASVAVITYNAGETIRDCLHSIICQDLPRDEFEILVVDSGSTDDTLNIVSSLSDIRLMQNKERCRGLARNIAIHRSRADIIAFIDADCVASPDWLRTHIEILSNEDLAAIGGSVFFPQTASYLTQLQHHLYFSMLERKDPTMTWDLATCNISFRRQPLMNIGLFDNTLHQGEDTIVFWNLVRPNEETDTQTIISKHYSEERVHTIFRLGNQLYYYLLPCCLSSELRVTSLRSGT